MPMTIEQIKEQIDNTKTQIKESKDLSPEEKMHKARDLELLMTDIKNDLNSLQGSTTETDKLKEIEELEKEYNKLQDDLNEFKWELDSIQDDIIDQTLEDLENDVEAGNNMDSEIIPSENDKPNWRERNKKTVLIWAGTLWVWLLIRRWWKKRKEKKEWGTTWSSSSEKKPWYKKWWGIGLIWVAWFLWIRWFMTWRNPIDRWGPWLSDDPEDQLSSYIEFWKKSPEEFKKYQNIWENTNFIYSKIYDKEINSWWNDADSLWKIWLDCADEVKDADPNLVYSWLVPYIMDKNFSSVWKIISPEWLKYQEWSSDIDYLKTKILWWWKKWISNILWPFLWSLQSWIWLWNKSWESIEDKFSRWAESWNKEDRLKELQFFFRQYMKINTYLICKKDEIMISIAKEKYSVSPDWFSSFEDAMENKDWFKKNIEKDKRYSDFMSWKLTDVSTNIESAGVSLDSLSDEIMEQVDELDEVRDKILHSDWDGDILDAWENDIKSWWLNSWTITKLNKSCDLMLDDIKNEVEDAVKDSCWDPYSYLFNTAWINKETFIENSWLEELFWWLKSAITSYQTKINSWSITSQEYAEFKNLTNQYFAMKKEMVIWSQTLQSINEWWVWRSWFLWWCLGNLWKSIENFIEWDFGDWFKYLLTWIAPFIVLREWYLCFVRKWHWIKRLKQVGNITFWAPKKIIQSNFWIAKQINWKYVWSPRVLRSTFFSWVDWPDKLWRALSNVDRWTLVRWKISLDKAAEIIENWKNSNLIDSKIKAKWRAEFPQSNKNLIKRWIVQKIIPWAPIDQLDIMVKYYDNKTLWYLIRNWDNSNIIKLRNLDDQIKILSKWKQNFILESLNKRVLDFDQVDDLVRNIDNIDITKISPNKLANWLAKWNNVSSVVDDLMKNSSKIENIDINIQKQFNTIIDDAIKSTEQASDLSDNFATIRKTQLDNLKISNLTQTDMEALISLHQKGIKAQYLPDISSRVKVDLNLEKALKEWDFDEFSKVARANKNLKNVDNIIWEFDTVLKRTWRYADDFADIAKNILKVVSKIA